MYLERFFRPQNFHPTSKRSFWCHFERFLVWRHFAFFGQTRNTPHKSSIEEVLLNDSKMFSIIPPKGLLLLGLVNHRFYTR